MISKKIKQTTAQTAILMVLLNLGCKAIGFVREMVMAAFYGTGYVVDSLVMAQSIPNILFGGILVAVSTAYMPLYAKVVKAEGEGEGNIFTSQIIFILLGLSFMTAILGGIFSKQIVHIMASGFDEVSAILTASYLKVTFAYLVFASIVGVYASFLQYKNSFVLQIFGDYIQNICNILMIIISAYTNNRLLVFGMFFGYAFRCIFLRFLARKKGYRYQMRSKGLNMVIVSILSLSVPVFLGTTVQEINTFVDRTLASSLQSGSISALNYANQISTIVVSLSVTILTTVIYPKLVQIDVEKEKKLFSETVQKGFCIILMIAVPVTMGCIAYGTDIIHVIYERGAFNVAATEVTASAYKFYSLGVVFVALSGYMTKVYYSMRNMKIPMICAGVGMGINIILNIILIRYMQQNGLALATSLAEMVNAALQLIIFKVCYREINLISSKKKTALMVMVGIISVGVSCLLCNILKSVTELWSALYVMFGMGTAILLYAGFLKLLQIDEFDYILRSLIRINRK